jgi:dihydrodipicolinate synthase/N-acetylneuraminate lyase
MSSTSPFERPRKHRKVHGIAAALLPYEADGRVAVDAFQKHLLATKKAGLQNAINMDTGYVNLLTEPEKLQVLQWTKEVLGNTPFVAGAYIEDQTGDPVQLYRKQMDIIVKFGGTPILFQTSQIHGKSASEKAEIYRQACHGYKEVLAFELGRMFAPNGEIFDTETIVRILEIPEIVGMKHSSLDRLVELERLSLRDKHRPDFRIYTGNDLGINMIEYGSDYLLGLATFSPEKFAQRDEFWEKADPRYFALSDSLQLLGNLAFREPVPAYKHSAATYLHLTGRIPTDKTHPKNTQRPAWETELMRDCARRLSD